MRLYGPMNTEGLRYRHHKNVAVVTDSAEKAIEYVSTIHPEYRLESCADTGEVHHVLDFKEC